MATVDSIPSILIDIKRGIRSILELIAAGVTSNFGYRHPVDDGEHQPTIILKMDVSEGGFTESKTLAATDQPQVVSVATPSAQIASDIPIPIDAPVIADPPLPPKVVHTPSDPALPAGPQSKETGPPVVVKAETVSAAPSVLPEAPQVIQLPAPVTVPRIAPVEPASPVTVPKSAPVEPVSPVAVPRTVKPPRYPIAPIRDQRVTAAVAHLIENVPASSVRKMRDKNGRYVKSDSSPESKSKTAYKKQTETRGLTGKKSTEQAPDNRLLAILSALSEKTEVKSAVGLAVLGPVAGAISEVASLGSSIKESVLGVAEKTLGKKTTDDKSSEAQIRATGEVTAAIEKSDHSQDDRNRKLIDAIQGQTTRGGKEPSAGRQAHAQATSVGGPSVGGAISGGSGSVANATVSPARSGGGIMSGVGKYLKAIPAPLKKALVGGVIAAGAGAGFTALFKSMEENAKDEEGQRKAFAKKDGEKVGVIEKVLYTILGKPDEEKPYEDKTDEEKAATPYRGGITERAITAAHDAEIAIQKSVATILSGKPLEELAKVVRFSSVGTRRVSAEKSVKALVPAETAASHAPAKKADQTTSQPVSDQTTTSQTAQPSRAKTAASHQSTRQAGETTSGMPTPFSGIEFLTHKYESGGDVGAVNDHDVRGSAYGSFQMHSSGTAGNFIKNSKWAKEFEGLKPGSKEFGKKWKEIAVREPAEFGAAQQASIMKTHYAPMAKKAEELGIDLSNSKMLQAVMLSTGVQHGDTGGPRLLGKAMAGKDPKAMSEEEIKDRIYAERGKRDINGNLAYFTGVKSKDAQQGLSDRYVNEARDATYMKYQKDKPKTADPKFSQPLDQILMPDDEVQASSASRAIAIQPQQMIPPAVASIQQAHLPQPAPIPPPKIEPQPVILTGATTASGGVSANGQSGFQFQQPPTDRREGAPRHQSQPQKLLSNIGMEFDDILLTLMAYDRI